MIPSHLLSISLQYFFSGMDKRWRIKVYSRVPRVKQMAEIKL